MTIAGISTAIGEGGIGIVRLSGDRAFEIGESIFRPHRKKSLSLDDSRQLVYGHIVDGDKLIDEVLLAFMKGPATYTREDVLEIYCHGGIVPVKKILDLTLKKGARLAEAGEFTKRAFLNGRLDLSQAEAIMDMIKSKTDKSYEVSLSQLEGGLSRKINEIRDILLNMIAQVEVSIDYPDEDFEYVTYEELTEDGNKVKEEIKALIETAEGGRILRDGIKTVILGKPNVGKSSLLNSLVREKRAIVTDIPGTTRDIIEEYINIGGFPVRLLDTAGIRSTKDQVEQIGVDMAKKSIEDADLIIGVFDSSRPLDQEDYEILDLIEDRKSLVILNKRDLDLAVDIEEIKRRLPNRPIIESSLLEDSGPRQIERALEEIFSQGTSLDSSLTITNIRHKDQLEKALKNIESALEDLEANVPIDCVEVDLKNAWENLGEISGDTIDENILDKIFSEFCLGK